MQKYTFANPADEPVMMLIVMAPGGFEDYFQEMAGLAKSGRMEDPGVLTALQSRYDVIPLAAD
jgi:hypothetical protein